MPTIKLHGIAASGTQEAGNITRLPWVKKQFLEKLGIDCFPGTFNLKIVSEDVTKLNSLKSMPSIEITPKTGFCPGKAFKLTVANKIKGAAIIPTVPGYPEDQLEIIADVHIKNTLGIKDGDTVEVEVEV